MQQIEYNRLTIDKRRIIDAHLRFHSHGNEETYAREPILCACVCVCMSLHCSVWVMPTQKLGYSKRSEIFITADIFNFPLTFTSLTVPSRLQAMHVMKNFDFGLVFSHMSLLLHTMHLSHARLPPSQPDNAFFDK